MLAWKLCTGVAATALMATAAARGEDGKATIIDNSAQAADSAAAAAATFGQGSRPMLVPVAADSARTATITGSGTVTLSGVIGNGDKGLTVTFGNADDAGPVVAMQSDYWLGVIASPPGPALVSQLKLPKDQGLVVEAVEPESPAAKAGVKQYDILLKGNDKPLTGLHDLYQLMNEVKEGKLKLDLLRAGTHEAVTVTPAKRPAHANVQFGVGGAGPVGVVAGNFTEGTPIRFRVVGPGEILPPGGPPMEGAINSAAPVNLGIYIETKLGDGSKVEITQMGSEPAKVVVTGDKEKWEATSNDLSKIPEKIRPEIEQLLHSNVFVAATRRAGGAGGPAILAHGVALPVSPAVEKRLSEMQKQIDELRYTVEALQGKDKAAPKAE